MYTDVWYRSLEHRHLRCSPASLEQEALVLVVSAVVSSKLLQGRYVVKQIMQSDNLRGRYHILCTIATDLNHLVTASGL